ncbi:hypothetical protein BJ508DRAFT_350227, partial [Ascobolus immersus RN42]
WLIDRLGQATTRRRQYFRYRQSHREKLAHESRPPHDGGSIAPSSNHKTTASSYVSTGNEDRDSDVARSDTSYAISEANSENLLSVPKAPKDSEGGDPFECPYCWEIIKAGYKRSWRCHVFSDLEPYLCTVQDCNINVKPFESRHDWFAHELDYHRSTLICMICIRAFPDMVQLQNHFYNAHETEPEQSRALLENCRREAGPLYYNTDCPFCTIWKDSEGGGVVIKVSAKEFQRHVGRHMEQLALFALPKLEPEDDHESEDIKEGSQENASVTTASISQH